MTEEALAEHYLRASPTPPVFAPLVYSVPIFTHVNVEASLRRPRRAPL